MKWNLEYLTAATTNGSLINTGGYNWITELPKMLDLNSKVPAALLLTQVASMPMIYPCPIPSRASCIDAAFEFGSHSEDYIASICLLSLLV